MEPTTAGSAPEPGWWTRRRVALVAAAAVILVAVIVVVALQASGRDGPTQASSSPTASPSASAAEPSTGQTPQDGATSPADDDALEQAAEDTATPGPGGRPAAAPLPLTEEAEADAGLVVRLESIEAVQGEANIPGEVAGPALRVTVAVENRGSEMFDLGATVVNGYHGADATPALTLGQPGSQPFPAQVGAGETATGVVVLSVPADRRDRVIVEVDLAADLLVQLFEGVGPPA